MSHALLLLQLEAPLPLILNIFFGLFKIWDWEMVRLHLLGESPEQFPNLRRPFPVPPSPFAGLLKQFTGGDEEEPAGALQNGDAAATGDQNNVPRVQVLEDDDNGNDEGKEAEPKKTK